MEVLASTVGSRGARNHPLKSMPKAAKEKVLVLDDKVSILTSSKVSSKVSSKSLKEESASAVPHLNPAGSRSLGKCPQAWKDPVGHAMACNLACLIHSSVTRIFRYFFIFSSFFLASSLKSYCRTDTCHDMCHDMYIWARTRSRHPRRSMHWSRSSQLSPPSSLRPWPWHTLRPEKKVPPCSTCQQTYWPWRSESLITINLNPLT